MRCDTQAEIDYYWDKLTAAEILAFRQQLAIFKGFSPDGAMTLNLQSSFALREYLAVFKSFNPDRALTLNLSSSFIAYLRILAPSPLLIAPLHQWTLLLLTPTVPYVIYQLTLILLLRRALSLRKMF
ncbi:MAG: VOC family protein [Acidobacteria bacterium]|nr:VOC family protein [Acidobacteriota bacterium]